MDKKASELMGESVIAGVTLEAQEAIKGAVGGVVGTILTGVDLKPASIPGDHTGILYVAVGPTKVGFFSIKRGLFKNSLDSLLIEHARSDVQTVEIKSGIMPAAHFVLQDGTHYVLMCPRIHLGKLKKVQELLVAQ
ncbi:MAG: hypothetical protein JW850_01820 [Thermoflexales bacterium]|nr:hypothetical protein [Thermoflexales bacterium]